MKPPRSPRLPRQNHALTLVEVVVVVAIIGLLLAILLPALAATKKKSSKINCVNNPKQIGLACLVWAGDNNDKYPAQVSVALGGAMEPALTGNAAAIFQVMSNELSTPKVLICPSDKDHYYATNFSVGFSASNISYFFSVDAGTNSPPLLLSGDDNFETNQTRIQPGLLALWTNTPLAWTRERHIAGGNVVFADGHVDQWDNRALRKALQQMPATNRLAIP